MELKTLQRETREPKTRRTQLVIRPSLHEKLIRLKQLTGLSVNEIVTQMIEANIDSLLDHYENDPAAPKENGGQIL